MRRHLIAANPIAIKPASPESVKTTALVGQKRNGEQTGTKFSFGLILFWLRFDKLMAVNQPQTIKVLIVDDDSLDVYLLHKALLRCGVENVESVRTGQDASKYIVGLAPFEERPVPDLVFLDLKMSDIDGFQFISYVKKNPIYRNIPLIVLSGSTNPDDKDKAIELGATAFFQKTGDVAGMKAMLEEVFDLCVS